MSPEERIQAIATAMRKVFVAMVAAGFTEDQALRYLAYRGAPDDEEQQP